MVECAPSEGDPRQEMFFYGCQEPYQGQKLSDRPGVFPFGGSVFSASRLSSPEWV